MSPDASMTTPTRGWMPSWIRAGLRALRRRLARSTPRDPTRALGARGERLAASLLERKGYRVLGRNVRVPMGEADIVCEHPGGEAIVLVEVKARTRGHSQLSDAYAPEAAVDPEKRRKLRSIASHLARHNGWSDRPVWLDVVAVECPEQGTPLVRHIERVPW